MCDATQRCWRCCGGDFFPPELCDNHGVIAATSPAIRSLRAPARWFVRASTQESCCKRRPSCQHCPGTGRAGRRLLCSARTAARPRRMNLSPARDAVVLAASSIQITPGLAGGHSSWGLFCCLAPSEIKERWQSAGASSTCAQLSTAKPP